MGIDLELTGSELEEIDGLLGAEGTEGLTDPVVVPEVPENPRPSRAICGCSAITSSCVEMQGRRRVSTASSDAL